MGARRSPGARLRDRGRRGDAPRRRPAADTRAAAAELEPRDVELILYAGGDGTTRDIVDAVGTRVPILGIPTGVKMHSGVFATSPEAAGDVAAPTCRRPAALREAEVMDVDEEALRAGRVSAPLYGVASRAATTALRVQRPKAASRPGDADLDALCRASPARPDGPHAARPGHDDAARPRAASAVEGTLLGVDAVEDGRLVGRDLNESQLLELLDGRAARARRLGRRRAGLRARPRQPAAEPGGDRAGRARRTSRSSPRSRSCSPSIRRACSSIPATPSSTASCPASGASASRRDSVVVPVAAS